MHHKEQTIMLVIIISIQSHAMQATLYLRRTSQSLVSQENTDRSNASVFESMVSNYRYPLLYKIELVVQFPLKSLMLISSILSIQHAIHFLNVHPQKTDKSKLLYFFLPESAHIFGWKTMFYQHSMYLWNSAQHTLIKIMLK